MNFLAHSYLSGTNTDIRIGNFIGDFVKGKEYLNFSSPIAKGVLLHREIDSYTDKHPIVLRSKSRLTNKYGHFSGVIVDIFYDHFLAANWKEYHKIELLEYTHSLFSSLEEKQELLPDRVNYMLQYMVPQNWLYNYRTLEGINQSLNGLSRRTKFDSGMENAVEDLEEHYDEFNQDFKTFFPDIDNFVSDYLKENQSDND